MKDYATMTTEELVAQRKKETRAIDRLHNKSMDSDAVLLGCLISSRNAFNDAWDAIFAKRGITA